MRTILEIQVAIALAEFEHHINQMILMYQRWGSDCHATSRSTNSDTMRIYLQLESERYYAKARRLMGMNS